MRIAIHQPEHMPWLGFVHKMALVDTYVILDTVQFEKNNWQNRNQFIDRMGQIFWLTVPVNLKGHLSSSIREITIDSTQPWQRKYWGRFSAAYSKHPYFKKYAAELEALIRGTEPNLFELNFRIIEFFRRSFGIQNKMVLASDLGVQGKRSELLVDICVKTKADCYLSGPSGNDYLEKDLFLKNRVDLVFHQFVSPIYSARNFAPNLSALDLLMNHGDQSRRILGMQ